MNEQGTMRTAAASVLDTEDLEGVLSRTFYSPREVVEAQPPSRGRLKGSDKPTHYKVICISMYTEDLSKLDAMVDTLKAKGLTKANRSALIRYALERVDLEAVPRGL